jgi:hypothetical protein
MHFQVINRNARWICGGKNAPRHTCFAHPLFRGRICLHQAEGIAFGVLAIREITDAWDRYPGQHSFAPSTVYLLERSIERGYADSINGTSAWMGTP